MQSVTSVKEEQTTEMMSAGETVVETSNPPTKQGFHYQRYFEEAVRNGDRHELQRILETFEGCVNVNLYDKEGQTALHQSCSEGNLELVKVLLQFGADVRLANRDGWNALHIALFAGHQNVAVYLVANAGSHRR